MPSFWKILCFPNHRYRDKNNTNRPRERYRHGGRSESGVPFRDQPEMINDNQRPYQMGTKDDTVGNIYKGSRQALLEEDRTKKRRRVQDIFTLDTKKEDTFSPLSENRYSMYDGARTSGVFDYTQSNRHTSQREFGSGYTPNVYQQTSHKHVDSMYGYVPKVVQNVYASKVLEGKQMDDFFNRLHRENSMTHFASKPLQFANNIVLEPESNSNGIEENDKMSLIPHTEIGTGSDIIHDMMETDDYNGNVQTIMAPRCRALNTNFEQIWNSTGEVLY